MGKAMANQQNEPAFEQPAEIDKKALYGRFYKGEDRRARIYERGVMQALDLADDEMQFNQRIEKRGIGAGGIAAIAAAVGIPSAGVAAAALFAAITFLDKPEPDPEPAEPRAAAVDTDSGLYLLDAPPAAQP